MRKIIFRYLVKGQQQKSFELICKKI